jgi:transcriptional regulator with XRE-family HTH domain
VADAVEVDQSAVAKWEAGDSTPLKKYRPKLCALLGCTEAELLADAAS